MPDTTPAAMRLIKVLEEATGMPLSMHGDDAALILDDAGVRDVMGILADIAAHTDCAFAKIKAEQAESILNGTTEGSDE